MKWMADIVCYNSEFNNVGVFIKSLGLSSITYRNKRREGWESQKAFEHCLKLKEKKDKFKAVDIGKLAREYGVSKQAIYKSVSKRKEVLEIQKKKESIKMKKEYLDSWLVNQNLSTKYEDFYDFCIREGLNANSIYKSLDERMSPYNAILASFQLNSTYNNVKYIYFGIAVKSLCQKYRLSYDNFQYIFKSSKEYELTFHKMIFNKIFSEYSINKRKELWKCYLALLNHSCMLIDYKISDNILNMFFQTYWKFQSLQSNFYYYQILEFLPISNLFFLHLEDRVIFVLTYFPNISISFNELYYLLDFENGFMCDFVYIEEKRIWVYKGNYKVLGKIKPSD